MTEPYALPPCEPGGPDPEAIAASIEGWVTSPAMAELVERFGGTVPAGPLTSMLPAVAEFSRVWDFRAGVRERFDTARVDFDQVLDARLRTLIQALGLGGRPGPAHERYDHVIVLGGGIRVALARTDYTVRLLDGGLSARTIAGLGSLRWRHDLEHREGLRLGLGPVETEADMMTAAFRRFLAVGDPTSISGGDDWWHRVWDRPRLGVDQAHVLAAASTRPPRRANTADTLIGWAEHVHTPTETDRVLLITNDPYVRHQHCDAVRLLGHRYGCGIETIGFDDEAMLAWGRPLSTTERLQEVRSSILATRELHDCVAAVR